ncbi:MAG: ABC transporter permease [Spirochaetota bacterium]
MEKTKAPEARAGGSADLLRKWGTLGGFIVLCAVFSILKPGIFPTVANWRNIIDQAATLAIVAAAVTMVMATGDFDLSVGAIASLAGVVAVGTMAQGGGGIGLGIAAGLAVGVLAGAFNGLLVAYGNLSAFVATLATMTGIGGIALLATGGSTLFAGIPEGFRFLGQGYFGPLPVAILAMIVVVFVIWVVMERTVFGRKLYAIGGNPEATRLAGVNVRLVRLGGFVISGLGAALGGIVLASRLFSAHPQSGNPFMLNSAAAVFLGATAFREGEPHIAGTLLGVLIMGVLGNGMNILGVNSYVQQVLTGAIIILAVLLSGLGGRKRG